MLMISFQIIISISQFLRSFLHCQLQLILANQQEEEEEEEEEEEYIMKRPMPCYEDDSSSLLPNTPSFQFTLPNPSSATYFKSPDVLIRRAGMYQDYMKQIPIPSSRGSVIPFTSWMGLGRSIKQLYGQPLHYLTNILLKQWDQSRIGSDDEHKPLDDIIHPRKAEATIWLMEEIHRQTSSHFHIANLWKMDPMYSGFVDSIIPTLRIHLEAI